MMKILFVVLAVFGAFVALNIFAPGLFSSGFHVFGAYLPWGLVALGLVGVLVLKAK